MADWMIQKNKKRRQSNNARKIRYKNGSCGKMDERVYALEVLYKYLQKGCLKNNVHNRPEI